MLNEIGVMPEDFMSGVWAMLQQDNPKNYVLASGEMYTVRQFINESLQYLNIDTINTGQQEQEKFYALHNNERKINITN